MSENAVQLQPSFVIHYRHYKENSIILDVLTMDFGRVSLLAKGVKKAKTRTAGLLQPFIPLGLSFVGKADLKTVTQVEIMSPSINLQGIALYCGFYLNDLVKHFIQQQDPHTQVFIDYRECLAHLSVDQSPERALRLFEINLLENVGYALPLEQEINTGRPIDPDRRYKFHAEQGAIAAGDGLINGKTLIAMRERKLGNKQVLKEAKLLLRSVIDFHLAGKQLNSRTFIQQHQRLIKSRING